MCIIVIVLFVGFGLFQYMDDLKNEEISKSNEKSIQLAKVAYDSIFTTNQIAAKVHYDSLMENSKAMGILKKFKYETDQDEKTFLRGELFRTLYPKYQTLKELGIRQFHFHTHKGESLLRFHAPSNSGDSLIGIRKSIEYVNKELKPFFGFEGGKIFPGFRYVFPIVYHQEHLGSIEFSIPFEIIESKLQAVLPKIGYQLHLDKRVSYDKVFDRYKYFFIPSPLLDNHYIENRDISKVESKIANNDLIQSLQTKLKPLVTSELLEKENFSLNIVHNQNGYRANFISIDEVDGSNAAHLVCYCNFDYFVQIEQKYFIFKILISIAMILIVGLLYIVFRQINKIVTKNKSIQQLLDTQDSIVILTDGNEINFANLKFFDFFGFKNLEDFKKNHKCICEYFTKNDKFFHLGKIDEDQNWVKVIQTLPHSQRVVAMLAQDLIIHAFSVTINKFDNKLTVINFTDISQTMLNYIELEEKSIHDKLTGALNREYFEQNYPKLLAQYHTKTSCFAVALLDIDHFKKVNDTHGHDIGDEVLIQFVKTIHRFSREDDILIRWGGEEFIVILKVLLKENLHKVLEHLRKVIEIEKFPTVGKVTCSIGGTIYVDGEQIKETIKRADIAVYEAKANGRNQVVIKEKL